MIARASLQVVEKRSVADRIKRVHEHGAFEGAQGRRPVSVPRAPEGMGELAEGSEREGSVAGAGGDDGAQRGTERAGIVLAGGGLGEVGPYEQCACRALPEDARPPSSARLAGRIVARCCCEYVQGPRSRWPVCWYLVKHVSCGCLVWSLICTLSVTFCA